MKLLKSSLGALLATAALAVNAQSVDDVVNKHITAIGGKDAISNIKSMTIESEVSVMGQSFPSSTSILVNKGFKNVTTVNGMEIIQAFSTDTAWSVNPLMGSTTPTGLSSEQKKMGASSYDVGGPLFNYKEKGNLVELAGNDSVNGMKAIKLKIKEKNGSETTMLLDPNTYYILKQEVKATVDGVEVMQASSFSDFKKTDSGLVMPFVTSTSNQGYEITITHTKIEFNKEIDPKIFELPKI
jgi:outer membrane lipoprotein-sorting protein